MTEKKDELKEAEIALLKAQPIAISYVQVVKNQPIACDEDVFKVTEVLGVIKKFIKDQEADRKKFVGPLNSVVTMINARYKTMLAPVREADDDLRKRLETYQTEIERKRQAEEERLRKEQEEKERKEKEEKEKAAAKELEETFPDEEKSEIVDTARELTPDGPKLEPKVEIKTQFKTDKGKLSFTTNWKYRVTDPDKIPACYKTWDPKKLQSAVDNGIRIIPGVEIYSVETPNVR